MSDDTLWINKTTKGDGAVLNVEGDVYYVTIEKIEDWLDEKFEHGLPLDKISDGDE